MACHWGPFYGTDESSFYYSHCKSGLVLAPRNPQIHGSTPLLSVHAHLSDNNLQDRCLKSFQVIPVTGCLNEQVQYKSGFLSPSTIDTSGQIIFVFAGGSTVLYSLRCIAASWLYPPASTPTSSCNNQKCSPKLPNVPQEIILPPVEKQIKSRPYLHFINFYISSTQENALNKWLCNQQMNE